MTTIATVNETRWHAVRDWILTLVVIVLGGRTAYLCFSYFFGISNTKQFQVESSALWFVLSAIILIAVSRNRIASDEPRATANCRRAYPMWVLGAIALYWPALTIGFLSDDFVLTDRASRFTLGFFNPEAFRPLPLAIWGFILHLGGGPVALHLLNIVLHGTNAFLTTRVVRPLARSRRAALLAGLIVLTMPILVEPVVWCSGVFDVMATTFVLLTIIASRDYDSDGYQCRVRLYAYSIAGLLSKETAMVVPALVALDAWVRRATARRLYLDIAVLFGGMGITGAVRLVFASATVKQPISKYLIQRWVFETVAGLAVPWHVEILRAHPWLPTVAASMLIALLMAFSLSALDAAPKRMFYAMSVWILISTAPALTFFFIAPDLQSSRYLYLATVGWAGLLVAMVERDREPYVHHVLLLLVVALSTFGIYGVRQHLAPWREAAATRDAFEVAATRDPRLRACSTISIRDAPDSVRGAYVLRNGAVEALRRDIGLHGRTGTATGRCSFRWNASTARFDRDTSD